MTLKLRVQFTIDIEAIDFVEAAEHQRVLQGFAAKLIEDYPLAAMHIKERRLPRLVQQKLLRRWAAAESSHPMRAGVMRKRDAILEALELFRDLFPGISMGHMIALLHAFENEGLTLLDLSVLCGFYLATASRAIRAFSAPDAEGALPPSLGLIELRRSPKGQTVHISEAGQHFRDQLREIIAESSSL
mgnify:CR=1 FL=1